MLPLLFFLHIFLLPLAAIEYSPWTERDLELLPALELRYQKYDQIDAKGSATIEARDYFLTASLSASYSSWSAEMEVVFADTCRRSAGWDSFIVSGRYLWLSDIAADSPFSLSTGLAFISAADQALRDFSSFHHGKYELEGYISIGKEFSRSFYWLARASSTLSLGLAERGSPWLRGNICFDKSLFSEARGYVRFFVAGLVGLGDRNLSVRSFQGYGALKHRSLEVGISGLFRLVEAGTVCLGYEYRPYSKNYPQKASSLRAEFLYPFGL